MHITGRVWMALTQIERLAMLEFASEQNAMRWQKKKSTAATVDK